MNQQERDRPTGRLPDATARDSVGAVTSPRWQQVADDLRARIDTGDLAPGARLPGRRRLIEETGASDRTILAALAQLQREGRVYVAPSSGYYVRPQRAVVRSTRNRLSRSERAAGRGAFSTDCHDAGLEPSSDVEVSTRPAPAQVSAELGIEPASEVIVRDRIMRGSGEVLQLATSYLPAWLAERAPAVAEEDSGPGGIYARIDDAGLTLTRFTETVRIGRADEHEARQMDLTAGDPVYRIVRVAYVSETAVETNHITITSDRYELSYELPAE